MTVETGWAFDSEPPPADPVAVTLFDQTSFCRSHRNGDIDPARPEGLFVGDTRVVSRWRLTVDGDDLEPMTVLRPHPYQAVFVCRARVAAGRPESTIVVERHRHVGDGMREEIVIHNVGLESTTVRMALAVTADFADLFQVKAARVQPAEVRARAGAGQLDLERADGAGPGVRVVAKTGSPATVEGDAIAVSAAIGAHETWAASFQVHAVDSEAAASGAAPVDRSLTERPERTARWLASTPTLTCGDDEITRVFEVARRDLDALRIFALGEDEPATLAAGVPWFMAVFGRDALFASWMALPLDPSLALGTLKTLARYQGTADNPLTEEAPGRMLHEIRQGAEAAQTLGGAGVYYGAADTTPLFVALLAEAARWGLSDDDLDQLLPAADRALAWVRRVTDRDGFVTYHRASEKGLVSQGWKDSPGAICFADGRIAQAPIALCEVQAYVYAAYAGRAEIARMRGEHDVERQWRAEADQLREAFNRRYWLADRGWYAVALDGDGAPVDALTSNIGHCLWSGIADDDKARAVADNLMSPQLFSGWGARTLATSMRRHNPVSYHRGCVWPWDNAVIAAGLARYGFTAEAARLAEGMFDAAARFDGRLPELFCGFGRDKFAEPVPFPAACSPQAWSSTTPISLLGTLLGLNPSLPDQVVRLAPVAPERMLPLRLANMPLGSARVTIDVAVDGGVTVTGLPAGVALE